MPSERFCAKFLGDFLRNHLGLNCNRCYDERIVMASSTSTRIRSEQSWLIWWPAMVMMLGTLLSYLDRQILALLSPMILKETHLSAQAYTETISAFSYAYMVATLIWGPVL